MSFSYQNQYPEPKEPSDLPSFYDPEEDLPPLEQDFLDEDLWTQISKEGL